MKDDDGVDISYCYPPEIHSANMCGGPGADSILAAAQAWERVAEQMSSEVLQPFHGVLDMLLQAWSGESGMQMHEATAPFYEWLIELQGQLAVTQKKIHAIRKAYATARDAIVPVDEVNAICEQRNRLLEGEPMFRDMAALADLDVIYMDFWRRDHLAVHHYKWALHYALVAMTPWKQPPPIRVGAATS